MYCFCKYVRVGLFFFEQIRKRTWSHFACACACEASWAFLIMDLVYAASRVGFLVEQ